MESNNDVICTVVSLVPFELNEFKPGLLPARYCIPASDGREPQVLHIGTARHYVYLDEARGNLPVRDSATEVARSIVEDYITSQLQVTEVARPGLFWVVGKFSAAEVKLQFKDRLIQISKGQNNWLTNICTLADDDWNKYHQHNVVSDFQRKAAQMIGWKPEQHLWMAPLTTTQGFSCPACGNLTSQATVVCLSCKCILDPEKYKTLQFV